MGCDDKCSISLRLYPESSHNGDKTGSSSIGTWENYASNIIVGQMMLLITRHWQFYVVFVVR